MDRKSFGVFLFLLVVTTPVVSAPTVLVDLGAPWNYFRGDRAPSPEPATKWCSPDFDDRSWERGPGPIGYEAGTSGPVVDIATSLDDMQNIEDDPTTPEDESQEGYASFFVRKTFDVSADQLGDINDPVDGNFVLGVLWDDGFVAYLNGIEVARSQAGAPGQELRFNDLATGYHEALRVEYFNISDRSDLLTVGENLLAIEVHNRNLFSSDCSFDLRLSGADAFPVECPTGFACTVIPRCVGPPNARQALSARPLLTV
jgi:hypothetical protein